MRVSPRSGAVSRPQLNQIKHLAKLASPLRFFWRQGIARWLDCRDGQTHLRQQGEANAGRMEFTSFIDD